MWRCQAEAVFTKAALRPRCGFPGLDLAGGAHFTEIPRASNRGLLKRRARPGRKWEGGAPPLSSLPGRPRRVPSGSSWPRPSPRRVRIRWPDKASAPASRTLAPLVLFSRLVSRGITKALAVGVRRLDAPGAGLHSSSAVIILIESFKIFNFSDAPTTDSSSNTYSGGSDTPSNMNSGSDHQ